MDKLRAMETFIRIADAGSLTAAARQLETSLPATVRMLAAYERHLGVRLFNRTTRRIALTAEGQAHLAQCRQLLAAIDEAEAALGAQAAQPAGQLVVTAPMLFGQLHVAPALTRFALAHPRLNCRMLLMDRVASLLDEGIDVGIRIGAMDDSSLVSVPLGRIRRLVVASPAFLRRHGTPAHPRELRGSPCVRVIEHAPAWGPFNDGGKTLRVPVTGQLEFNQIAPAVQACEAGAGFGNFFSYQVAQAIAQRRLRAVLREFEPAPLPLHAVYPHARLLPARTRLFIDWMRRELASFAA